MPPPQGHRNVLRCQPKKSSSNCCCKCICCCCCFLLILILILGGLAFYIYTVYQPKIPSYSVQGMDVTHFDLQPDFSLRTVFLVTVKAENPNTHIGFIYGEDSSVVVTYSNSVLSSGVLPSFEQGPENTTMMKVEMKGVSEFGSGLQEAFQENKETGKIPLLVKVKAPVKVVVGSVALRELVVFVNCSLVVDKLQPGKKVGIVKTEYCIAVQFGSIVRHISMDASL